MDRDAIVYFLACLPYSSFTALSQTHAKFTRLGQESVTVLGTGSNPDARLRRYLAMPRLRRLLAGLGLSAGVALASGEPAMIREPGRCAMYGSCGRKGFFGGELPCPDNDLAREVSLRTSVAAKRDAEAWLSSHSRPTPSSSRLSPPSAAPPSPPPPAARRDSSTPYPPPLPKPNPSSPPAQRAAPISDPSTVPSRARPTSPSS